MEIRKTPLPPDLQYCLDGGVEWGHITGGAHVACFLFADIDELDRVHAIPHPGTHGWASTAAMCAEVEAYGQSLIRQIDDPTLRDACLGATTTSFLRGLNDYGEFVCGQSYEDAIWGGSMIHRHNTAANWRGRIHQRLARRLRTDAWVKRSVRRHHGENGYEHLRHLRAILPTPLPPATTEGFELLNAALSDQRGRSAERSRQWVIDHSNDPAHVPPEVEVRLKPAAWRARKRARGRQRRSIIRAAAIASAIVGASQVGAFARGEAVRLEGDQIVMEVRSGGLLGRIGHGGVTVVLKSTDNEYLAGLCVYQELPALDQLASLALHVQSGDITDVIRTGNLFNPSPTAFAHPVLVGTGKTPPPRLPPIPTLDGGTRIFPIDDHSARQALMRGYEDEMGDRFRRRVFIDVLGSREGASAWQTFVSFKERTPA